MKIILIYMLSILIRASTILCNIELYRIVGNCARQRWEFYCVSSLRSFYYNESSISKNRFTFSVLESCHEGDQLTSSHCLRSPSGYAPTGVRRQIDDKRNKMSRWIIVDPVSTWNIVQFLNSLWAGQIFWKLSMKKESRSNGKNSNS